MTLNGGGHRAINWAVRVGVGGAGWWRFHKGRRHLNWVLREENCGEKKRKGDDSWREGDLARGTCMSKDTEMWGSEACHMARVDVSRWRGKDWPFFLAWGSACKCSVKFVCCWDEILEHSKVYYLTSNSSSKNVGITHPNIQNANSPSYFELMWFVFLNPLPVIEKSPLERGP